MFKAGAAQVVSSLGLPSYATLTFVGGQQLSLLLWMQMQQDAEAAAQAELSAEQSTIKLDPGQLQRLKQRNHELMQRKVKAKAAEQQQEERRLARLQDIQEQVGVTRS